MPDDDFVFDWTKKLGFSENPFHRKVPDNIREFYVGNKEERKKLNFFILEKHPFGTIRGKEGFGKTSTLKWMISQLKKHRDKVEVAYINAQDLRKERDLIEGLSKPLLNFYEKNVKRVHKKLSLEKIGRFLYSKLKGRKPYLILVDDVEGLPNKYLSLFKYFFKNDLKIQLIVAGGENAVKNSKVSQIGDKDWLDIELDGLSQEEMKDLVKNRISYYGKGGIYPFQEEMLDSLYEESNGNPAEFLKACREKAVKLALDQDYIREQAEELEDTEEGSSSGLISIKLGKDAEKEEDEDEDLFDELGDMPPPEDQDELVSKASESEEDKEDYSKATEEVVSEALEDVKSEEEDSDEDEEDDKKHAEENEKFLSELAKEFK